ncbi:MAG: DNA polymerase III subunit beta [Desulfobacterium sp.]|jgi:DNA polymerase-3 subunit beta|nr:DNA polymerase III subunit beta [Desulfobacterium sp.]
MKFSSDRKNLTEVLAQVQGICNKKTSLAFTSDVLIKVSGSEVVITANDLETVFQGRYEADIESDGVISINAKKLYEIIREYPDSMVTLNEVENRWVEIGKEDIQYHIVSSEHTNFTDPPMIEDVPFVEIDSAVFKKMVEVSTMISGSTDEKRIYVIGALLEKIVDEAGEHLRMVSTDSKRLNSFDASYEGNLVLPDEKVIIPKKGLLELGRFLDREGSVNLGVKDDHLIVQKQNETMMIKLLEGDYPDYKRIINTEQMTQIEMSRSMLLMVMRRMSIFFSDDYKSVILNFKENELVVTFTNPEIGESKENITMDYTGELFESAFNPKYFIDALNAIDDDTIILNIKGAKHPCIIKGHDDDKFVCAIMAMSV